MLLTEHLTHDFPFTLEMHPVVSLLDGYIIYIQQDLGEYQVVCQVSITINKFQTNQKFSSLSS